MDKEKIKRVIEEYNRYRGAESRAKLLSLSRDSFEVEFTGSFCYTCGFYDYFDDLKILLEEDGLKTEIAEIREIDEGAIVKFTIPSGLFLVENGLWIDNHFITSDPKLK